MRKIIGALLASAAIGWAVPAAAAVGYIGGAYERQEIDTGVGDSDFDGVSLNGSVAFDASESLGAYTGSQIGVQLDAGYVFSDDDDTIQGAAHVFTRNQDWLWGGYLALADAEDTAVWGLGAEANRYFDRYTLAGSVGYTSVDDLDTDVISIAGELRYFLSEGTRIDGGLGWANVDAENGGEDDAITLSIGAEHQIGASPASVFASYTRADFDDADVETSAFLVGLRWNFAPSLIDRDREGPSLNQSPLATRFVL